MLKSKSITGADFKCLREKKKMTQPEFAELLGYAHYQRVLEIEKKAKQPIPATAVLRLKVANFTLDKPSIFS